MERYRQGSLFTKFNLLSTSQHRHVQPHTVYSPPKRADKPTEYRRKVMTATCESKSSPFINTNRHLDLPYIQGGKKRRYIRATPLLKKRVNPGNKRECKSIRLLFELDNIKITF